MAVTTAVERVGIDHIYIVDNDDIGVNNAVGIDSRNGDSVDNAATPRDDS